MPNLHFDKLFSTLREAAVADWKMHASENPDDNSTLQVWAVTDHGSPVILTPPFLPKTAQDRANLMEIMGSMAQRIPEPIQAVALATEAWMADYQEGNTQAPAERKDRREVLLLSALSLNGEGRVQTWPILRSAAGEPMLNELNTLTVDQSAEGLMVLQAFFRGYIQ